jgi:endoglucanase
MPSPLHLSCASNCLRVSVTGGDHPRRRGARFVAVGLALALLAVGPAFGAIGPVDGRVRLNSVGFTPSAIKQGTVAATATAFRVLRTADDTVVLEGALGAEVRTAAIDTGEALRIADFSALRTPGEYQLEVTGVGRSAPFAVAGDVWNEPLWLAMRGFYLWRCGAEVSARWNGRDYHHAACHLNDAWLDYATGSHAQRDGRGGWHDAGDYNKYVVNAGVSVGLLLKAWEHQRARLEALDLGLPESGNGVPDFLHEVRWELEWLLKMQGADGRVYSKISELSFGYWGVPEGDATVRYFVPWSTTATADFAAMMAQAARVFAEFDAAFATRCLAAARSAGTVLSANLANVAANQAGFSTGTYEVADPAHRLWAAAELWATTGEASYLRDFESRAATAGFSDIGPTWADPGDLGLATYLEASRSGRDAALVARLRTSLRARASAAVDTVNAHAYGRGLGGLVWFWGANGSVAAQTFLLHLADRIEPDPRYRAAAEETIGFLFGRNFHNRSYVTGLGYRPPEHPHDRRGEPVWPGYLVGGGWPTGRSWQDVQGDYQENEIAINWNASLVYALAALAESPAEQAADEWAVFTAGQPGAWRPAFAATAPESFTASGLPAWASVDATTGTISGTPGSDARRPRSITLLGFRDGVRVASRRVNLMVAEPGTRPKIVNLSARGLVGAGEDVLVAGFVPSGTASRPMLLRGVGPTLRDLGISDPLQNPTLTLFQRSTTLAANDDWGASPRLAELRTVSAAVGANPLREASRDAVLLENLSPRTYTMHVAGVAGATGVALAEIYDGDPSGTDGQLVNISARARVASGESVLIAGTVLEGGGVARVLVRAVGPTLATQDIAAPLADPVVTLYSRGVALATNDDWGNREPEALAAAAVATGAFALPRGSHDAALIATLPSGAFTVVVEGKAGTSGVALVELYLIP